MPSWSTPAHRPDRSAFWTDTFYYRRVDDLPTVANSAAMISTANQYYADKGGTYIHVETFGTDDWEDTVNGFDSARYFVDTLPGTVTTKTTWTLGDNAVPATQSNGTSHWYFADLREENATRNTAFAQIFLGQPDYAPGNDNDRHAILWAEAQDELSEFWIRRPGAVASVAATFNLNSPVLPNNTNGTPAGVIAARLPLAPFLFTYADLLAPEADGTLGHMLGFVAANYRSGSPSWPARGSDGELANNPATNTYHFPAGTVLRLKPDAQLSFSVASLSAPLRVLVRTLQKYGVLLYDKNSSLASPNSRARAVLGVPSDPSWPVNATGGVNGNTGDLGQALGSRLQFSDFEVVDMSGLMVASNSMQVATPVGNQPPVAVFTKSATGGIAPLAVTFDGTGSYDLDDGITTYIWDFGDGAQATGASAAHTYTTGGAYNASLTVVDGTGASTTAVQPVAVGSFTKSGLLHSRASVTGSSSISPGMPNLAYPSLPSGERVLEIGDDVIMLVSVQASITTSMPAGWTKQSTITGLPNNFKTEVWRRGRSTTTTWASLNPTVTLSTPPTGGLAATAVAVLVRGSYVLEPTQTSYGPSTTNPLSPPFAYSGPNAYSVGWAAGANYSVVSGTAPQLNPSTGNDNGPQGGWMAFPTSFSNLEPGHKLVFNLTDAPAAPTFTNSGGNKWSYVGFSIAYTGATASFTRSPASGIAPLSVTFTDTSSAGDWPIISWAWDFGDGATSTSQNPTHTYNTAGIYPVTLTVTTQTGETTTSAVQNVTVSTVGGANQPPTSSFTTNRTYGIAPLTVAFDGSGSSDPNGDPLAFRWNFDDGKNVVTSRFNFDLLSTVDGYTNTLVASLATGDLPEGITSDHNGTSWFTNRGGLTVSKVVDEVVTDTWSTTYQPYFVAYDGTALWVTHLSANKVSKLDPDTGTVLATVDVTGWPYDVVYADGFVWVSCYQSGEVVKIDPTSNIVVDQLDITNNVGYIRLVHDGTSTLWATSQPSSSLTRIDTTSFTVSGTVVGLSAAYGLTLDYDGYVWVACNGTNNIVKVHPATLGLLGGVITGASTSTVVFDRGHLWVAATGSNKLVKVDPATRTVVAEVALTGPVQTYVDRTNVELGTTAPSHTFVDPGTYRVRLTVTDPDGLEDTTFETITVIPPDANQPPSASFGYHPGPAPFELEFTSTSTDPEDDELVYYWRFGDGASAGSASAVAHTYATGGLYNASLTVTDAVGSTDTQVRQVYANELEAELRINDNNQYLPQVTVSSRTVSFVVMIPEDVWATGDYDIVAELLGSIDFDDGTVWDPTGQTATLFRANGTFSNGRSYELDPTGDVISEAFLRYLSDGGTLPTTATLVLTSTVDQTGDTMEVELVFELSGTVFSPIITSFLGSAAIEHVYATDAVYNTSLTFSDNFGRTAVSPVELTVATEDPVARITADPATGNAPLQVAFSGAGSTDDGSVVSYVWGFGDGASATGVAPTHTYTSDGTYNASLTVTDNDGFTDTAVVTVEVVPHPLVPPISVFSVGVDQNFVPVTATMDPGYSYDPDGSIVLYAWDFGDGTTATSASAAVQDHVYSEYGSYTVRLTVTDTDGLTATSTQYVDIIPAAGLIPKYEPEGPCPPNLLDVNEFRGEAFTFLTTTGGWGTAGNAVVRSSARRQLYDDVHSLEVVGDGNDVTVASPTYQLGPRWRDRRTRAGVWVFSPNRVTVTTTVQTTADATVRTETDVHTVFAQRWTWVDVYDPERNPRTGTLSATVEFTVEGLDAGEVLYLTAPVLTSPDMLADNTFTVEVWSRLPEYLRTADEQQAGPDFPLLRFVDAAFGLAGQVEFVWDWIRYVPRDEGGDDGPGAVSRLVDPQWCCPQYLPWLARLVGVDLVDPSSGFTSWDDLAASAYGSVPQPLEDWDEWESEPDAGPLADGDGTVEWGEVEGFNPFPSTLVDYARWQVGSKAFGLAGGTVAAIKAAAQQVLTGTKTVRVTANPDSAGNANSGDRPWLILVETLVEETPDVNVASGESPTVLRAIRPTIPAGFAVVMSPVDSLSVKESNKYGGEAVYGGPWNY